MRRYALDATSLLGLRTGIARVVGDLVAHVSPRLREDEELVLCARVFRKNPLFGTSHAPLRAAARSPRVRVVRQVVPATVAERFGPALPWLPVDLEAGRLDVFHATRFLLPVSRRARGVLTVHDLGFLRYPEHLPARWREQLRRLTEDAAARADVVVAVSDATARDVVELLRVPRERVVTIHPGVSPRFLEAGDPDRDRARIASRYGLDGPYVLCVAATHPRKNLPRLLDAFALARRRASLPHRLVLVGEPGYGHAEVVARTQRADIAGAAHHAGFVDDDDLPALYRCAGALAYPSLHEGFGFPILEAFASGCPVLTSSASSLPEVAGDAALLVDPASTDAIGAGLERVLTDETLRARLVSAGRTRAGAFTWDAAAERHLAIYRELADCGQRRAGRVRSCSS